MAPEHLTTVAEFLVLLIIVIGLVVLVLRIPYGTIYRSAIGLALLSVILLVWVNLAVGIIGEPENPANLMYFVPPAIGFAGAITARFTAAGMSHALLAAALAQVLVALITIFAGMGAPVTPTLSYLVLNGILVALWVASALLFRKSAQAQT